MNSIRPASAADASCIAEICCSETGCYRTVALEYNIRGIPFYQRNGFELTGEKMIEDDCVPLLKLVLATKS